MDASHFEGFVRSLRSSSRREWLAGFIALASALVVDGGVVAAKHKRHHHKKRKHKKPSCRPDCAGGPCTDDGCGGLCPCDAPGVCPSPGGQCCNPEGTPCTSFEACCSQTCDSLVGGGTCAPCAGRTCTADRPCCGGLDCINGYCDGCRDRATSCTSSDQCCFSDCKSGACLSTAGGRCVRDVDCRACYLSHNCTNACVDGACAF
jgi:hypothetical protein